jgi:hypothetical protein
MAAGRADPAPGRDRVRAVLLRTARRPGVGPRGRLDRQLDRRAAPALPPPGAAYVIYRPLPSASVSGISITYSGSDGDAPRHRLRPRLRDGPGHVRAAGSRSHPPVPGNHLGSARARRHQGDRRVQLPGTLPATCSACSTTSASGRRCWPGFGRRWAGRRPPNLSTSIYSHWNKPPRPTPAPPGRRDPRPPFHLGLARLAPSHHQHYLCTRS